MAVIRWETAFKVADEENRISSSEPSFFFLDHQLTRPPPLLAFFFLHSLLSQFRPLVDCDTWASEDRLATEALCCTSVAKFQTAAKYAHMNFHLSKNKETWISARCKKKTRSSQSLELPTTSNSESRAHILKSCPSQSVCCGWALHPRIGVGVNMLGTGELDSASV
jgi:hypothetical protein